MILPVFFIILCTVPTQGDYPDAAALITQDITSIEHTSDFKRVETRDVSIHILNIRGRERYGEMITKYDSEDEELVVTNARTVKPDGSSLTPADKAIADLSSWAKFIAPVYTNLKVKTVVFSAVAPGDVVEYSYRKSSKEESKDEHIFGKIVFQGKDPITHKEFVLKVPAHTRVSFKIFGDVECDTLLEDQWQVYKWWVDSIPRRAAEPYAVPASEFARRVVYTDFEDWQEVKEWLSEKFEEPIKLKGSLVKISKELVRGKSELQAIENIYRFIVTQWRDISISMKDAGFVPTPVQEIYENRYGDLKDKCALLIAMLRAANIEAYPAYVSYSPPPREIPSPSYFKWVIAVIPQRDGYLFLDPRFPERARFYYMFPGILSDYNFGFEISPNLIGKTAFVVMPDKGEFTTIPTPDPNIPLSSVEMRLKLSEDGDLAGSIKSVLRGFYAVYARQNLRHKKEDELKSAVESLLGRIKTGTKAIEWKVEGLDDLLQAVEIDVEFKCESFLTVQDEQHNFTIPPPVFGFFDTPLYFGPNSRIYPSTVVHPRSTSFRMEVQIPESLKPFYLPEAFAENNQFCSANASYAYSKGLVVVENQWSFKRAKYEPSEYEKLLAVYKKYARPQGKIVIFERKD